MKLSRISFLFLLLFLFVPSETFAQKFKQSAVDKSWQPFWTKFSVAVDKKDRKALRQIMSSDFFDGGGGSTASEWLQEIQKQNLWGEYRNSVAAGTKKDKCSNPCRVTKNNHLTFEYRSGRWFWTGLVGD